MHKAYKCRAGGWKNPPLEALESPALAARACPPGTTPAVRVAGPPVSPESLQPAHQRRDHPLEELGPAAAAAAAVAAAHVAVVAHKYSQGALGMGTVLLDRTAALALRRNHQANDPCRVPN